ncbi:MAG TPA: hypothetical protein ENI86_09285 [Acidimicrobiales bacterium]|nr:hypothetical protein [Acidimicrobiales bacterium]
MTAGSTLAVVKAGLKTRWEARAGLSGIPVSLGIPPHALTQSAIWFESARADDEIDDMRGGSKQVTEEFTLDLVIQALDQDTDSAADTKIVSLLAEIQADLAEDPTVGGVVNWVVLDGWEHALGWWQGRWHARLDVDLRVRAHLDVP